MMKTTLTGRKTQHKNPALQSGCDALYKTNNSH